MTATVKLDGSNRTVLSRDLRRAAGIPRGQKLKVSATPGRVVLEVEPNPGKIVKRGQAQDLDRPSAGHADRRSR